MMFHGPNPNWGHLTTGHPNPNHLSKMPQASKPPKLLDSFPSGAGNGLQCNQPVLTLLWCVDRSDLSLLGHMKLTTTTSNSFERVSESVAKKRFVLSTKKAKANARRKEGGPLAFNLNITICPPTTHNQLTSPPAPQYDLSDLRRGRRWRDGGETKKNRIWPYARSNHSSHDLLYMYI